MSDIAEKPDVDTKVVEGWCTEKIWRLVPGKRKDGICEPSLIGDSLDLLWHVFAFKFKKTQLIGNYQFSIAIADQWWDSDHWFRAYCFITRIYIFNPIHRSPSPTTISKFCLKVKIRTGRVLKVENTLIVQKLFCLSSFTGISSVYEFDQKRYSKSSV